MADERKKLPKSAIVRGVFLGAICVIAIGSAIFGWGAGSFSSLGLGVVAYLCPVGALEAMFGNFAFVPRLIIAFVAVALLALLLGRAFCSWACPVPPLQKFFRTKKEAQADEAEMAQAGKEAALNYVEGTKPARCGKVDLDSRHIVLCGAVGSAAIFGFPVFCLICPIGLTFAIVVGLVRLVGFNEPSFSILIFAAILLVELLVLRKWCFKFCPVGALLSLFGKANRTFRPTANPSKCLRTTADQVCGACASACPELIDPQSNLGERSLADCTRCGKCADACPASAITFPLLESTAKED